MSDSNYSSIEWLPKIASWLPQKCTRGNPTPRKSTFGEFIKTVQIWNFLFNLFPQTLIPKWRMYKNGLQGLGNVISDHLQLSLDKIFLIQWAEHHLIVGFLSDGATYSPPVTPLVEYWLSTWPGTIFVSHIVNHIFLCHLVHKPASVSEVWVFSRCWEHQFWSTLMVLTILYLET